MAYRPVLGGRQTAAFPLQFPRAGASSISFACTLILQLSNDGLNTALSHGSGCFWRNNSQVYLLTARHVLTGRSPFDDSILSKTGYIPQQIRVFPTVITPQNQWQRLSTQVTVDQESPNWLQDPEFENLKTDIAALRLNVPDPNVVRCLNDSTDIFDELYSLPGMECAVVGYPTQHFNDLMTPIWRRGSIASEPMLPLDEKPMFLLDAATSPGFSGSPVFRQHFGPVPEFLDDGSTAMKLDNIRRISFVGIYAGRLEHATVGGEVPFVFYGNRVPLLF